MWLLKASKRKFSGWVGRKLAFARAKIREELEGGSNSVVSGMTRRPGPPGSRPSSATA